MAATESVKSWDELAKKSYAVELEKAWVCFGESEHQIVALKEIDFAVPEGAFLTLIGPSGCGKSTLLRLVSDLGPFSGGKMRVLGKSAEQARINREIAFVFQDDALLPWRTALENVRLPQQVGTHAHHNKSEDLALRMLALVGLKGRENAMPHELSGGMRQRVSIARALVERPRLLLMDEPFGALDEITRDKLNEELLRIWQETEPTIMFVTHSIAEAVFLAQKVLVLSANPGQIHSVVDVNLPYPRLPKHKETAEFIQLAAQLRKSLEECQNQRVE